METCSEEQTVEAKVRKLGVTLKPVWGSTLLHIDDLPEMKKFPGSYTQFRKVTEHVSVRELLPSPKPGSLPFIANASDMENKSASFMPDLIHFGIKDSCEYDPRAVMEFKGGENAALTRL